MLDQVARFLADDVLACRRHLPHSQGRGGPAREEVEQYQGPMPPLSGKGNAASQGGVILGAICRAGVQANEAHAGPLWIPHAQEPGAKQAAWGEGRAALHWQEFGMDKSGGAKSPPPTGDLPEPGQQSLSAGLPVNPTQALLV